MHCHTNPTGSTVAHAPINQRLLLKPLLEHLLAGISVLGEPSDTLVELVKGHVVVEQLPSEGRLIVEERDLFFLGLVGGRSVELLGDGVAGQVSAH